MDTLALALIALGIVAAIGVVLVAMGNGGSEEASADKAPTTAATPQPEPARPKARRRRAARAPQAVPLPATSIPLDHANGYGPPTPGEDPLLASFLQMVSGELDTLRQQQEAIDRRLKLIDGISALVRDMQPSSASRPIDTAQRSNGAGSHSVSAG
jgi:hypothetical protein